MRSEELVRSLRSCADCCGKCSECAYERHEDCAGDMKRDAADEIERLTKELEAKKGLTLVIGDDGVAKVKEEPYATIDCDTEEDYKRLTEAVKRMEPRPVVVNLWAKWIECPACGEVLFEMDDDDKPNFCRCCGQALDWEADDA